MRLPEEEARQVRDMIASGTTSEELSISMRGAEAGVARVKIADTTLYGRLHNLPTITEVYRTNDHKLLTKVADVAQILICSLDVPPSMDERTIRRAAARNYPHGLTPPLKNVRRRRFRRTAPRVALDEDPHVERELQRVLKADSEAELVRYEIQQDDDEEEEEDVPDIEGTENPSSPGSTLGRLTPHAAAGLATAATAGLNYVVPSSPLSVGTHARPTPGSPATIGTNPSARPTAYTPTPLRLGTTALDMGAADGPLPRMALTPAVRPALETRLFATPAAAVSSLAAGVHGGVAATPPAGSGTMFHPPTPSAATLRPQAGLTMPVTPAPRSTYTTTPASAAFLPFPSFTPSLPSPGPASNLFSDLPLPSPALAPRAVSAGDDTASPMAVDHSAPPALTPQQMEGMAKLGDLTTKLANLQKLASGASNPILQRRYESQVATVAGEIAELRPRLNLPE